MTADEGHDEQESSEEIRPSRMTAREQQIGFVVAALGLVVSVAAAAAGGDALLAVIAGLAAIGLGVASRYGHRIVTAFVAILGGFAFVVPANFAFLGYGGYLMWQSSRAQAKLRASQPRMTPAERRAAKAARRAAKRGEPVPAAAKRPTRNRRYTPPKAKPGRPG